MTITKSDQSLIRSEVLGKVPYGHRLTPAEIDELVSEFEAEMWNGNAEILADRRMYNEELVRRCTLKPLSYMFRLEVAYRADPYARIEDRSLRVVK